MMIPGRGEAVSDAMVVVNDDDRIDYAGPRSGAPASTSVDTTVEVATVMACRCDPVDHRPPGPNAGWLHTATANPESWPRCAPG